MSELGDMPHPPGVPEPRPALPADVYRAQGVLAERLGVDPEDAATALEERAAAAATTVLDAARAVLQGSASAAWSQFSRPVLDPWGGC